MTPENFAYWLQGFIELNPNDEIPTKQQWDLIKEHLNLVFHKVTNPLVSIPVEIPKTEPITTSDKKDIKSIIDSFFEKSRKEKEEAEKTKEWNCSTE